ncbi:hypothetical protein [Saccharopolyspora mangrovi]|uniref:Uncharacterized protein n=1 Tax=Saccharopolyspora mangrovi TaxID=3082379 RepID=A0ABU6AIB4_9PSEU|nr:hypothetical protein [Saccharopolyspora sp. S2-29]MEB3371303.1 hypothetical protein [Saccharopolyspora sp. S2-29]
MFGAKKDPRVAEEKLGPVELAQAARERGDVLLQVQMTEWAEIAPIHREMKVSNGAEFGPILSEIEKIGWRLEHVSTTSMPTRSFGSLVTVYVFHNTEH